MGFTAKNVEGWADTGTDGQLDLVTYGIELAPGSDIINLDYVTVVYLAANGTVYCEYEIESYDPNDPTTYAELVQSNLGNGGDDVLLVNGSAINNTNTAYVVKNRSSFKHADRYVESGELYVLGMKLPQPLEEGQDWSITLRAPYTQDLVITGYAPDKIKDGTMVRLK